MLGRQARLDVYRAEMMAKLKPEIKMLVTRTVQYGAEKQFSFKAEEDDGLGIYYNNKDTATAATGDGCS